VRSSPQPSPSRIVPWAAILLLAPALAAEPPGFLRVQPPPFMDGLFPCSRCHTASAKPDTRKRGLEDMHENIVLNHLGPGKWCLECHDPRDRDHLHLASGERVPFEASYRLCGQCHGDELDAWTRRQHGQDPKDPGGKEPLPLCVRCHNPHSPKLNRPAAGK